MGLFLQFCFSVKTITWEKLCKLTHQFCCIGSYLSQSLNFPKIFLESEDICICGMWVCVHIWSWEELSYENGWDSGEQLTWGSRMRCHTSFMASACVWYSALSPKFHQSLKCSLRSTSNMNSSPLAIAHSDVHILKTHLHSIFILAFNTYHSKSSLCGVFLVPFAYFWFFVPLLWYQIQKIITKTHIKKLTAYFFFLVLRFRSSAQVFDPFWADFCVWSKILVQYHFLHVF